MWHSQCMEGWHDQRKTNCAIPQNSKPTWKGAQNELLEKVPQQVTIFPSSLSFLDGAAGFRLRMIVLLNWRRCTGLTDRNVKLSYTGAHVWYYCSGSLGNLPPEDASYFWEWLRFHENDTGMGTWQLHLCRTCRWTCASMQWGNTEIPNLNS